MDYHVFYKDGCNVVLFVTICSSHVEQDFSGKAVVMFTEFNITVGHRTLSEQTTDMAVHCLFCTDIVADRFSCNINREI